MKKMFLFLLLLFLTLQSIYAQDTQEANVTTDKQGHLIIKVSKIKIPGIFLAHILPLPGVLKGFINEENTLVGLNISEGVDFTKKIITSKKHLIQNPSDIIIICNYPSTIVTAESHELLQFPVSMDTNLFVQGASGWQKIEWGEGLLSMVQDKGRKVILKGKWSIQVADPNTLRVIYLLEYDFGNGSSIIWQKDNKKFIWSNMKINKKKINQ